MTHGFAVALVLGVCASAAFPGDEWRSRLAEGQSLFRKNDMPRAEAVLSKALSLARAAAASARDLAGIEHLLALVAFNAGDHDSARSRLQAAVDLLATTVSREDETLADWRGDLAALQTSRGDLDGAERTLCSVLEIGERGKPRTLAHGLHRLAMVAVRRRHHELAFQLLRRAAETMEKVTLPDVRGRLALSGSRAWLAIQLGDAEEARVLLDDALLAVGKTPSRDALGLLVLKVDLFRRQGRLKEAVQCGREALETHLPLAGKDHVGVAELVASLAEARLDDGDPAGAERELGRVALREPATDDQEAARVRLAFAGARLALQRGERDAARENLVRLFAMRKDVEGGLDVARAWLLMARVEQADGAHARAAECADRAAQIFLRETTTKHAEARQCFEAFDEIRARAVAAGVDEPSLPPRLRGLRLGDALEPGWEETDRAVKAAVAEARQAGDAGDLQRAVVLLEGAAKMRPGEGAVHSYRGLALVRSGKSAEAIAAMDMAIRCRPPDPARYVLRAVMCGKAAWARAAGGTTPGPGPDIDRAIVDATYALHLGGDQAKCFAIRGMARGLLRQFDASSADFTSWKAVAPADPAAYQESGWALLQLGRFEEAERDLLEALKAPAEAVMARLRLADLYRRKGEPQRALAECARVRELAPDNSDGPWLPALIHVDSRSWQLALASLDECRKVGEPSIRSSLCRWLCLRHVKSRGAADEALRAAIDSGAWNGDALVPVAKAILAGDAANLDALLASYDADPESLCRACFYLGMWRDAEDDAAGAAALLDRAAALGAMDVYEKHGAAVARARLRR